jgi:hypothetical protein
MVWSRGFFLSPVILPDCFVRHQDDYLRHRSRKSLRDLLALPKPTRSLLYSVSPAMPASSSQHLAAAFARAVSPSLEGIAHSVVASAPDTLDSGTAHLQAERSARHLRIMGG